MDSLIKKPATADKVTVARPTREVAEDAVRTLIAWTGDDPSRSGLVDTPGRVLDAWRELCAGYGGSPESALERTFEDLEHYDDLVLVRSIPVFSHCEHHMMPFIGVAHIAYYPAEQVTGLSKLARLVDTFARRLQSQERLTSEILEAIDDVLAPRGTAVMIDAEHTCMTIRGIRAHGARTTTTRYSGVYEDNSVEQTRFITLIGTDPGE
ncbi:MAG: GTP cyclohydrolase I FolE [Alphaproteobacteria bacterium]